MSVQPRSLVVAALLGGLAVALPGCTTDLEDALRSASRTRDGGATRCPPGLAQSDPDADAGKTGCVPCDVGTYCPGGSGDAKPCVAGTWDHDANPRTDCREWTNCPVGGYVLTAGHASADRVCAPCGKDTFSVGANAAACSEFSSCGPGSYVRIAGSATADQVCGSCPPGTFAEAANLEDCESWTDCEPGEVVARPGNGMRDRECAPCPEGTWSTTVNAERCSDQDECPPGTIEIAAATSTEPPECDPCDVGQYCAGGDAPAEACAGTAWDHDADPGTACREHTACEAGSHVAVPGGPTEDRECEACPEGSFSTAVDAAACSEHTVCEPGTFVLKPGTDTGDAECRGCPSGSFSDRANQASCSLFTECQPGEFVKEGGTAMRDRSCEPCPPDTFSEGVNAGSCVEVGQCPAGTRQRVPATDSAPAECELCQAGQYCLGGEAPASECGDADWDDDEDPSTPCAPKTTCVAGEYVYAPGDALTDRSCAPCDAGEFSSAPNSATCAPFGDCEPGTYVAAPATSSSDRACEPCQLGTFSTSTNASSCVAWTSCPAPSTYVATLPSATSDRQCGACTPPEVTLEDNAEACILPAFQMADGRIVMEAENYHAQEPNGSQHAWQAATAAGASSGTCMDVLPEYGYSWSTPVGFAPELQYRIDLPSQGTFYVHLRGDAGGGGSGADSVFAAVDDVLLSAYDFDDVGGVWGWRQQAITIPTSGRHVFSIFAREDGFRIDKIVISSSATSPTGSGPPETPQG